MKPLHLSLTVSLQLLAAGVVAAVPAIGMAQEATPAVEVASSSTLTRAEVTAEVIKAREAGTLMAGGEATQLPPGDPQAPALTRAEVKAGIEQARADGTLEQGGEAMLPIASARPPVHAAEYRDDARAALAR